MFERFADDARQAIVRALGEVRGLRHENFGTEHLLLSLIDVEHGVGARMLTILGVSLGDLRARVAALRSPANVGPSGHVPFTDETRQVLIFASREAERLGSAFIDTEHLLLGILSARGSRAADALQDLGASLSNVRAMLVPPSAKMASNKRDREAGVEER